MQDDDMSLDPHEQEYHKSPDMETLSPDARLIHARATSLS